MGQPINGELFTDEVVEGLRQELERSLSRAAVKAARLAVVLGEEPEVAHEALNLRMAAYFRSYYLALNKRSNG